MTNNSKKTNELPDIDAEKWHWFNCTELFEITGTKSFTKTDIETYGFGAYPYVCTSSINNGIDGLYDKFTEEGNVITIDSATVGSVFYQNRKFTASDHVEKLIPKFKMNSYIAKFLCTVLSVEKFRYGYGRKFSQTRIKETKIKLPVDSTGKPDWQFMENYIKSISKKVNFTNSIGNIHNVKNTRKKIDISKWGDFEIVNLFKIKRGKRLVALDRTKGNLPYYSASDYDNGLTDLISNPLFTEKDSLIYTTFGKSYYVRGEFTTSDEVSILKNKNVNEYSGLFIASILNKSSYKFSFGRKAFKNKIERLVIKLPVDSNSKPDWQFMENYIKSLPYSEHL